MLIRDGHDTSGVIQEMLCYTQYKVPISVSSREGKISLVNNQPVADQKRQDDYAVCATDLGKFPKLFIAYCLLSDQKLEV